MRAVVLLSGGLDSATALACALEDGYDVLPFSVNYGQRHSTEMVAADGLVTAYHRRGASVASRVVVTVAFPQPILGSALTDTQNVQVPLDRPLADMSKDVPVTYVPARNTFLLGLAASFAEQQGASRIYTGFNVLDYSGYPDCRPEYVEAYNALLRLGMQSPAQVCAPLVYKTKAEIVQLAVSLNVPLELTWSCYTGGERPCGRCDSCILRAQAFAQCGLKDPAL